MSTSESIEAEKIRMEFRHIYGGDASVQRDFYAEFMRRLKEKGEDTSHGRAETWAERFKRGDEFQFSDREHRQILLDVMASKSLGGGTAGFLDDDDIKTFVKKHSSHSKHKLKDVS